MNIPWPIHSCSIQNGPDILVLSFSLEYTFQKLFKAQCWLEPNAKLHSNSLWIYNNYFISYYQKHPGSRWNIAWALGLNLNSRVNLIILKIFFHTNTPNETIFSNTFTFKSVSENIPFSLILSELCYNFKISHNCLQFWIFWVVKHELVNALKKFIIYP